VGQGILISRRASAEQVRESAKAGKTGLTTPRPLTAPRTKSLERIVRSGGHAHSEIVVLRTRATTANDEQQSDNEEEDGRKGAGGAASAPAGPGEAIDARVSAVRAGV